MTYHPLGFLQNIEAWDTICCNCGQELIEGTCKARRVRGHPICGRPACYNAQWAEFNGHRSKCGCPKASKTALPDFKERQANESD